MLVKIHLAFLIVPIWIFISVVLAKKQLKSIRDTEVNFYVLLMIVLITCSVYLMESIIRQTFFEDWK